MRTSTFHFCMGLLALSWCACVQAQTVRVKATADIWVSSERKETNLGSGGAPHFKLKSIQEFAAIRFDAAPVKGKQVLSARLFLMPEGENLLRYLRVSTVNGDWVEGKFAKNLGQADDAASDGASYDWADTPNKKPWSWPGSQMCDVVMGNGQSLTAWGERKVHDNGWISVSVPPELVYALACGDSDGLAVMDGGTVTLSNNFVYSVQSPGKEPYLEVELGGPLEGKPVVPQVSAEAAPQRAHLQTGAVQLAIAPDPVVFCWRISLNGKPLPRWQAPHPAKSGSTRLCLDDLAPQTEYTLEVTAVSAGGIASPPAKVTVKSSPALPAPPKLGKFGPFPQDGKKASSNDKLSVWAAPPLVKISPETGLPMQADMGAGSQTAEPDRGSSVWDGKSIQLAGAQGEFASFQLCIERDGDEPLKGIRIEPADLNLMPSGGGPIEKSVPIPAANFELFKNWYAKPPKGQWQPAYCVPITPKTELEIPDTVRKLPKQNNQTVYVDLYIPKDAKAGEYTGSITVSAGDAGQIKLPIALKVWNFCLPDKLTFWPQLNCYGMQKNMTAFFRLAHQNRVVFYYRAFAPKTEGAGKDIKVVWGSYDKQVGPLLSGEAFKDTRRPGVPQEALAMPFWDSWPTPLSKSTYSYSGTWPGKGDPVSLITDHYMTAPYIGDAMSAQYKEAFLAVERQFIDHFKEKGWDKTQMQCVFVGKNTHRTGFGINMWWTTDEPYHWDDWLALQFFNRLFAQGRGQSDPGQWAIRADISRPQWQDGVLAGCLDVVYYGSGAFVNQAMRRRCQLIERDTGARTMAYGGLSADTASNSQTLAWVLNCYLNGADAALPWQAVGSDRSLDENDGAGGGGYAALVPGDRLGVECLADIRVKAFRDGEQIVEYLNILASKHKLNREQLAAMVLPAMNLEARVAAGASADNADALQLGKLTDWQIDQLRRRLATLIEASP